MALITPPPGWETLQWRLGVRLIAPPPRLEPLRLHLLAYVRRASS